VIRLSERRIVGLVLVGFSLLAGIWLWRYAASSLPPFGYYYDLGVNIQAAADINAFARNLADVEDAIGWAGWSNGPQFIYEPLSAYTILVPLTHLLNGNAFIAVKVMQVLEIVLAAISMKILLGVYLGRRSYWSYAAGAVYAVSPVVGPEIRGNVEFGLVAALLPMGLAIALLLLRRFGSSALPLGGVVICLMTSCIVAESTIFVTLPLYALLVVSRVGEDSRRRIVLYGAAGLLVIGAFTAYYSIPTLSSRALFTAPLSSVSLLASGEYSLFSQDLLGLAAMVPREQTLSSYPLLNASNAVWLAAIPALLLWLLAITSVRKAAASRLGRAVAVVALTCIVLGLGANLPLLGSIIWGTISHLPIVGFARTPDRFMLPLVALVILCAFSLLSEPSFARWPFRRFAWILLPMFLVAFSSFDLSQHCFSLESSWDQEPNVPLVQSQLDALGQKRLSLALVDNGPSLGFTYYGAGIPYDRFSGDLISRYLDDGVAGMGLQRRLGVRGVVTSLNRTTDEPGLPDFSTIIGASPIVRQVAGSSDPNVFAVKDPLPMVRPVTLACYQGGPGAFDLLLSLRRYDGEAFVRSGPCRRTAYVDFDPLDYVTGNAKVIAGDMLFPGAAHLQDQDYRFQLDRLYINDPWYRNAVDGDAAILSKSAVHLDLPASAQWALSVPSVGRYDLRIRMHCDDSVSGDAVVDGTPFPLFCAGRDGFQWVSGSTWTLRPGAHVIDLAFDPDVASNDRTRQSVALDGVELARANAGLPAAPGPADLYYRVGRFLPPIGNVAGQFIETGSRELPHRTVRTAFYWNGPEGTYRLEAFSKLTGIYSTIGLGVGAACCIASAPSADPAGDSETGVYATAVLHPGEIVSVFVTADLATAQYSVRGLQLEAALIRGAISPVFQNGTNLLYRLGLSSDGMLLPAGERAAYRLSIPGRASRVVVRFEVNGSGSADLRCGTRDATALLSGSGGLSIIGPRLQSCSILMQADSETTVNALTAHVMLERLPNSTGRRFIFRGDYLVKYLTGTGRLVAPVGLTIDGRPVLSTLHIRRSGTYRFDLLSTPTHDQYVALLDLAPSPIPARVRVLQSSAIRWVVDASARASIEAAVFPDGNWELVSNGAVRFGHRCDLTNTCFDHIPAGDYLLLHRWPRSIVLGLLISLLSLLCACACIVRIPLRRLVSQRTFAEDAL
jgi:hypothetical protein